MDGICTVVNGKVYIPASSITDPRLISVEDKNRDGAISGREASSWVAARYYARVNKRVFAQVYSQCGVFDKAAAIEKLRGVRRGTMQDIQSMESAFRGCGIYARRWAFQEALDISFFEGIIINRSFTNAARKGVGQLGIFFWLKNGKISYVRPHSAGKKAGLRIGDQLISIDGIKFKESYQYLDYEYKTGKMGRWEKLAYEMFRGMGGKMEDFGAAMYGKCGSVANVVIERDGRRMTLKIKRGAG